MENSADKDRIIFSVIKYVNMMNVVMLGTVLLLWFNVGSTVSFIIVLLLSAGSVFATRKFFETYFPDKSYPLEKSPVYIALVGLFTFAFLIYLFYNKAWSFLSILIVFLLIYQGLLIYIKQKGGAS